MKHRRTRIGGHYSFPEYQTQQKRGGKRDIERERGIIGKESSIEKKGKKVGQSTTSKEEDHEEGKKTMTWDRKRAWREKDDLAGWALIKWQDRTNNTSAGRQKPLPNEKRGSRDHRGTGTQ